MGAGTIRDERMVARAGSAESEQKGRAMSDLERRVMLGALGVGAIAALAKAGPINPPAGPVTPTGRTLDEVYNKIPEGGGGDGRIAIPGGTTSYTISQPGSYVLTGNRVSANTAIVIGASGVTLDLNGYAASCTTTATAVISVSSAADMDVVIRNGIVSGGTIGVSIPNSITNVLVEDLLISRAKTYGIRVNTPATRDVVIRRCVVTDIGATTVAADGSLTIGGISVSGSSVVIEECVVQRLIYNGSGTGTLNGISTAGSTVVRGCAFTSSPSVTGTGVLAGVGTLYRDNTVSGFTVAYSGGVSAGGNYP